jgi:PKD repeat protein
MNALNRLFLVFSLLFIAGITVAAPVFAATTEVHIVKYAGDRTTVLAERTLTYQEMEATLPVLGDGITHYWVQGPVFIDDPDPALEEQLRWNPAEDINLQDKGALKGTNMKDLCDLVGGMKPGDTVVFRSADGWNMDFAYRNVYEYSPREGPIVLVWSCEGAAEHACSGYTGPDYPEGMRIHWFADTSANPYGVHAFGNWDWHEAASSEFWYYFYSSGEFYPTTSGLSGKYISEIRIYSSEPVPPGAEFSAVPLSGYSPLNVRFTEQSAGNAPLTYAWDFQNDGVVDSEERHPFFVYDIPGTYTVRLTVTSADGTDDEVKTDYITVNDPAHVPPGAWFAGEPASGELPLSVQFTDSSTLNPTSWSWDFGDGATSDLRNPDHTYTAEGTYTVTLTAANDYGSDTVVRLNYVTARSLLWGPYLTGTTTTGSIVNVKTFEPAMAIVEYATDAYWQAHSDYDRSATDGVSTQLHHIALADLAPDALYHYRVVYGTQATGDFTFRTFPESGPFTFVVYSDTQDQLPSFSQTERHKLVADRIAQEPGVLFVLNSGDLVNDASDPENWDRYFIAGGSMMATMPVFPSLGNHENNDPAYFEIFGIPSYYSFDCADAHISVLDSMSADFPTQSAWLASDLQTDKPFRFASFHYPPYTSDPKHFGGFTDIREEWEDELTENNVLAVFNGHVHAYERFYVDGINYFVEGIGGAPSYSLQIPHAEGSVTSFENRIGYTRVTVDPVEGTATAEVIVVADISDGQVTLLPPGTIFETVVMRLNTAPVVDSVSMPLEPQLVNADVGAIAYFTDPDDAHTAIWDWGDGTTSVGIVDEAGGKVTGSHAYPAAGVYPVTVTLTDRWGASASNVWKYVVVYTPVMGELSGSGFIMSPAGAYAPDPAVDGKASFSLTARYNKGIPSGNARFNLEKAKTSFTASYFDWIINEDGRAMVHGYGKLEKEDGYSFLIIITDGKVTGGEDTYRIIIWDPSGDWLNDRILPVYDNANGLILEPSADPIAGGSIVIR